MDQNFLIATNSRPPAQYNSAWVTEPIASGMPDYVGSRRGSVATASARYAGTEACQTGTQNRRKVPRGTCRHSVNVRTIIWVLKEGRMSRSRPRGTGRGPNSCLFVVCPLLQPSSPSALVLLVGAVGEVAWGVSGFLRATIVCGVRFRRARW